jgi:ribonuclease inhibitor
MRNLKFDSTSESGAEAHIDFARINSEQEVHELFARSLPFPKFYGHNWDAFWDVLTGFDCFPRRLVLSSTEQLRSTVPRAYEQLQACFANCQREYPDIAPIVVWQ